MQADSVYNYFRDYDPSTGRYVQSDPIGLAGGLNTYGYVNGNPLNWVDSFGLSPRGWTEVEGQPGVYVPNNMVQPDKCATGNCGAGLTPLPPPETPEEKCNGKCNLLVGLTCGPATGASGATGPGAIAVYAGCRALVWSTCKASCFEPQSCKIKK